MSIDEKVIEYFKAHNFKSIKNPNGSYTWKKENVKNINLVCPVLDGNMPTINPGSTVMVFPEAWNIGGIRAKYWVG